MPAIAGIFSADPQSAARLRHMLGAITHDPADALGNLHDTARGIHVGWSLQRGTFADCLPIHNESGDITLLFCGEVFTDAHRLCSLERHGHRFGRDNASHLVHWYEEEGASFVEQLNGSFCGLLIDLRRDIALLFNDRYGASRLYLHQTDDGLYFASQAKALLRLFPPTRRLNAAAVAQTFTLGCVLAERTLFEGIRLLPPASCWTIDRAHRIEASTYFDASTWELQEPLADDQFPSALYETFNALLPSYLSASGVRPAMSLTGGIDGRMIMACARPEPGTLPCYSFGSMYRDCHDVTLARRIAALCGQTHRTLLAGPQMLQEFPALADRCIDVSDGTMDVSGAVELYVNRLAREVSPLRITGNYGSEIVRSNVAFRPRPLDAHMLDPQLELMIAQAQAEYHAARKVSDLAFIAFKQVPWHHHSRLAVEQSVLTPRSPYLDNRLVALMFRASAAMRRSRDPSLGVVQAAHAGLGALPTDRGLVGGPAGAVARLRHALREFSVRAEYAYDYGMPKPLVHLDRLLAPLRPERLFLGRHKFYHFRIWYRRELAPFLRDMLLSPNASAQAWYRPGVLRRMVDDHVAGRANHTLDLHRALTLELTQRRLIDNAGAT